MGRPSGWKWMRPAVAGSFLRGEQRMSKNSWIKWGLLVAGSTVAALQLGNCIAQFLLQSFILNAVN